jgi:hypothetical protein
MAQIIVWLHISHNIDILWTNDRRKRTCNLIDCPTQCLALCATFVIIILNWWWHKTRSINAKLADRYNRAKLLTMSMRVLIRMTWNGMEQFQSICNLQSTFLLQLQDWTIPNLKSSPRPNSIRRLTLITNLNLNPISSRLQIWTGVQN